MNSTPIVSIIIPTYKRTDFLRLALQSVLAQTFTDFEVIIVEDGLAGMAEPIVSEAGDARVRYINQDHAGRSVARNLGLKMALGRYIAFLDDDDLYLPTKLAEQVAFLEEHPTVDLLGADAQVIDERGVTLGPWRATPNQQQLSLLACVDSCPFLSNTVMLRRSAVEKLQYWFDTEMDLAEDTDFFIRLVYAGAHVAWLPKVIGAYRFHGGSSQWDGRRYSGAWLRLLDKLFAQSDLPGELLAEKSRLYANYHLMGAYLSYATGQATWAQAELERAVALQPDQAQSAPQRIFTEVSRFADTLWVSSPRAYIDYVFDHLPPTLACLQRQRNECHSAFHMGRVFDARQAGRRPPLKDWLWGVYYAPHWLRDLGVWSMFADSIFGPKALSRVRGSITRTS